MNESLGIFERDQLNLFGRNTPMFYEDLVNNKGLLKQLLKNSRVLIIGGAGTIGSATCLELINFEPKDVHVIDISENNLVELVRDIRSQKNIF